MPKRRQRGEGGLFQRADGQWVGSVELGWIDGRRRRRRVYGKTMAEAQDKLNKAKADVAAGNRQTHATTLQRWLMTWLADVVPGKRKMTPKTLSTYESYVRNYIVPTLGTFRLDQIEARHIRALHVYITRDKGLSATTAGHAHAILSTALNDAIREGLIRANPCELVDHPVAAGNQRRALTLEEVRRFLLYVDGVGAFMASRWATALLLGMRQGECLGLRWDRIDFGAGAITVDTQLQRIPYVSGEESWYDYSQGHRGKRLPKRRLRNLPGYEYIVVKGNLCLVRTKTESSKRVIPAPGFLLAMLWKHRNTCPMLSPHGLVWTTADGGPIEPTADLAEWHFLLAQAGIEDTDQHSARHTASTLLLALGVGDDVRMQILGHSTAAGRRAYTHVDLELSRRAMLALESAITEVHDQSNPQQPRGAETDA